MQSERLGREDTARLTGKTVTELLDWVRRFLHPSHVTATSTLNFAHSEPERGDRMKIHV